MEKGYRRRLRKKRFRFGRLRFIFQERNIALANFCIGNLSPPCQLGKHVHFVLHTVAEVHGLT